MIAGVLIRRGLAATLLFGMGASCGARTLGDLGIAGCPPAPLRDTTGSCSFDGSCRYDAPRNVGTANFDAANDLTCTCDGGQLKCGSTEIGCVSNCSPPRCPFPVKVGGDCSQPSNAECMLSRSSSDSPDKKRDHACACDDPGPIWRCVPI